MYLIDIDDAHIHLLDFGFLGKGTTGRTQRGYNPAHWSFEQMRSDDFDVAPPTGLFVRAVTQMQVRFLIEQVPHFIFMIYCNNSTGIKLFTLSPHSTAFLKGGKNQLARFEVVTWRVANK